jgi:sugar/nucleoside kinase (ribokinase family)
MRLEYPTDNVDERILTVAAVADPFVPADVASIEAGAILISPSIRGEVPLAVVETVRAKARLVGLDVQGYVRVRTPHGRLAYEPWPELRQVLGLVDVLKSDAVEGEFLTGERDLHAIARKLASYGPKEIVLTHKDGLVVLVNGTTHEQPFLPVELRGRSGRGDTCVGSYLSKRLSAEPAEATVWAAALTSLKLEAEGPIRRSRADVEAAIRNRYTR